MRKYFNQKGFTLLELLVGMVILPIVLISIWMILNFCVRSYPVLMTWTENTQDIRQITTTITREIQNAKTVTSPTYTSGATASANQFIYSNGSIKMGAGADLSKLVIISGTDTLKLPAKDVTISFTRDGTNDKKIDFQITLNGKTYNETVIMLN